MHCSHWRHVFQTASFVPKYVFPVLHDLLLPCILNQFPPLLPAFSVILAHAFISWRFFVHIKLYQGACNPLVSPNRSPTNWYPLQIRRCPLQDDDTDEEVESLIDSQRADCAALKEQEDLLRCSWFFLAPSKCSKCFPPAIISFSKDKTHPGQ